MAEKLIIFDCFGVIFEEVAPTFLKKFLAEDKALIIKEELFVPADLGQITYDELLTNMARVLEVDKAEMTEEWNAMFILRKSILPVIKALGKKHDVILLSNAPLGVVEEAFEKHGLTPLFKRMFISCNLGLAKPDKEIYLHCVREMGKNYDEIYMIDDNWSNLEHLPEIGITPVHFKGDDSLLEMLI
ncbi:MAG: HAD family hydrolase [Ruminococcaceae bacterium]|nr:HAD family hydrolase [Oscillospiraceae bacterium]